MISIFVVVFTAVVYFTGYGMGAAEQRRINIRAYYRAEEGRQGRPSLWQ